MKKDNSIKWTWHLCLPLFMSLSLSVNSVVLCYATILGGDVSLVNNPCAATKMWR